MHDRHAMQLQPREESPLEPLPIPETTVPEESLEPEPHWNEIIDAATD